MKINVKKGLVGLLTGLAFAVNSYSGINLPKGYEYFDKENYYRFNKYITVTKITKGKDVGWLVYDTRKQEIIGDEKDELDNYKKYATMAEAKNIMDALIPEDVKEMASLYKKGLAGYEIAYKIPNFVIEKGSKLEGKLLRTYFTGGKGLAHEEQKKLVKMLIDEEKKEIVEEFYKDVFGDDDKVNPVEAAERAKKYLLDSVEYRMLNASSKLNKASEILERSKNREISYEDAEKFLNYFIEGNSTGRAYLNAIDKIRDNVNWKTISQKIVRNLAEGAGVKDNFEMGSVVVNDLIDVDLANIVFGNGDFMDVFNDIEKEYLAERGRMFKILEGKYNLKDGSVSDEIVKDFNNFKDEVKQEKPEKLENIVKKEEAKKEEISKDRADTIKNELENIKEKIAFTFSRNINGNLNKWIYVMNADGTNQVRLTNDSARDWDPAWSPDGTKIAFNSHRDGNREIYVMNADGTNQIRLTNDSAYDSHPAWSPDGTKIAFTSDRGGGYAEIYVMNADGSNQTRLTYIRTYSIGLAWSPDGTKIAFVPSFTSYTSEDLNIYVMNADGTNQVRLTNDSARDWDPAWSVINKITFTSNRGGGYAEIYVMNADGTNQVRLTYNHSDNFNPSWSPDGTKIAFTSERDGNGEIYVMNADGTNQVRLTYNRTREMHDDPAWSP